MTTELHDATDSGEHDSPEQLSRELIAVRRVVRELPEDSLERAIDLYVRASQLRDTALMAGALTLQGQVLTHIGDLHGALELGVEAERLVADIDDQAAWAQATCLRSNVSYFTGKLTDALECAHEAIRYADATDDVHLRLFVRCHAAFVFGTAGVPGGAERAQEMLELAVSADEHDSAAAAYNDWGLALSSEGEIESGLAKLDQALVAAAKATPNTCLRAVILGSRAEVQLLGDMPAGAMRDADQARELMDRCGAVNPYLYSAIVSAQVQARTAGGDFESAREIAEQALSTVGGSAARMNGAVLAALAEALHDAGRYKEAYEVLARSAEIERDAFRELEQMRLNFERATLEVSVLRIQLERDWLTGLYNRRFLAQEIAGTDGGRFEFPLCVAVLDVDYFKQINDSYGHPVGDQVLIRLATLMREAVRPLDLVARSGGEEFTLVLPNTGATAGAAVSDRLRRSIEAQTWEDIAPGLSVTASIGVAAVSTKTDFDALVRAADANLYAAKRSGRNRVVSGWPKG